MVVFLASGSEAWTQAPLARVTRLYPGITQAQSDWAHQALHFFYDGYLKKSYRALNAMEELEERDTLPPLSQLLEIAVTVMQLQRNDAEDEDAERVLRERIQNASETGLGTCREKPFRENPTCELIQGGIEGFLATMKISNQPTRALNEGLHALKSLDRAIADDERLQDAYFGVGVFQCTVANAPMVVRLTVKMLGRKASLSAGLSALRHSAYRGQYTSVASQLFLIQFLSPYEDELRREKWQIFQSLEETFPHSAYHTFLRWEEALCFYPDSFYQPQVRPELEMRLQTVANRNYADRRYWNLVKYQYTLLNPKPGSGYAPDTTWDLREFDYYPIFIQALRLRKIIRDGAFVAAERTERIRQVDSLKSEALNRLEASPMTPSNRRWYAWHIQDALRPEALQAKTRPRPARPDSLSD